MSTVVFIGQQVPQKNLKSKTTYKFHPNPEMKEQILAEISKNLPVPLDLNEYEVELDLKIHLNQYEHPVSKEDFWYDKEIRHHNDTKNT